MATSLEYFWKKKTILSFVAIFLVVIIHSSAISQYSLPEDNLTNVTLLLRNIVAYSLGSVAVPFFFFVSGISLFRDYTNKLYFKKLHSRIKTLLIPFLIWNIIGLIFALLYTYTPLSQLITGREPFSPSFGNVLEGIFLYKYNFAFWFVFYLIIFTILTPLFNLLLSKKWLSLLTITLLLSASFFIKEYSELNLDCVVFYFIGCYLGKYHIKNISKIASTKLSVSSILIFTTTIIIKALDIYNIISLPTILSELLLIVALFSFWFSSDIFLKRVCRAPRFTEEFFPVYALHTYFIAIIVKILFMLLPKNSLSLLLNEIASPILTIIIVTILAVLWRKFFPKTYRLAFGRKTN